MWEINISYTTGNSFGSEDTEDLVGYSWNNLEDAKEALAYIKEHYAAQQGLSCRDKEFIEKYGRKVWCDKEYPTVCLLVPDNDGGQHRISAFWCGYFESLQSASIITEEDTSMSFEVGR